MGSSGVVVLFRRDAWEVYCCGDVQESGPAVCWLRSFEDLGTATTAVAREVFGAPDNQDYRAAFLRSWEDVLEETLGYRGDGGASGGVVFPRSWGDVRATLEQDRASRSVDQAVARLRQEEKERREREKREGDACYRRRLEEEERAHYERLKKKFEKPEVA